MGKEIVVNVLVNSVICDSGDFYITKNAQPCVRCVALAATQKALKSCLDASIVTTQESSASCQPQKGRQQAA